VVVVSVAALLRPSLAWADPVATTATVLRVVDGDTVDIVDDARGRLRVRLLGIDTPETKKQGFR
jgi:micrococcal nuclease